MSKRSFTLIELLILVLVIVGLLFLLLPSLNSHTVPANRVHCAANLGQICKSMALYASENAGVFPSIPFTDGQIVGGDRSINNLKKGETEDPFVDPFPTGDRSVSQNLWLLCREQYSLPKMFLCITSEQADQTLELRDTWLSDPKDFVDFPWTDPAGTISYSFIQPWSKLSDGHSLAEMWTSEADPRMIIGADANNGQQPDYGARFGASALPSYKNFKKYINSSNHSRQGQNVLFADGRVQFCKTSYVGIQNDNIYTSMAAGTGLAVTKSQGEIQAVAAQRLDVRPRDQFDQKVNLPDHWDSVLVPTQQVHLANWARKP